jgi:branched-chain amino acid transport system substrate-binding protein
LARALALSGDEQGALELFAELEDAEMDGADRDKIKDVSEGRLVVQADGIRVGVVVPRTGGFAPVGEEILHGVQLAAARYERDVGVPVELIIVDEALESDSTGFGIPELESQGVIAVIGPIRSDALRAAAAARTVPGTLIISPTATEDTDLGPHAYSIWARERRDRAVAEALGNWLVSTLELTRVAAFFPANESGLRRSELFQAIVESAGFEWVGSRAYEPDSTTFETELSELTELDPDAILIVADGPRQVLQIAPQLHFFGLRGRIALVSEDWTHPTVLRRLDPTFSDFRVAATYLERTGNPEWDEFAADWDKEYRRAVPDNTFAALGYDAGILVLRTIPDPTLIRPGALARSIMRLRDQPTATGHFSFDPAVRRLVRSTRLRMILDSQLVDPDPEAIVEWSLEVRAQEEERLRLEAEEELLRRGQEP